MILSFYSFIWLVAQGLSCGMQDLVPWPGIECRPPALGAQSLSHWATAEVPNYFFLWGGSVLRVLRKEWSKAETPVLWPPHAKSWLIGKDPDAGRDWGQEKGTTEDEMAGWHHRLDGLSLSELWELVKDREAWRAMVHEVAKSWTLLSDWTELNGKPKKKQVAQKVLCSF